ncbi:MAG: extracellular solute-binding protein [Chloroflexi bacterium]|nr:extracellular solute-binding protein [Chloroflexota bacterium]
MKKLWIIMTATLLLALVINSCAPPVGPAVAPPQSPARGAALGGEKPAWEQQWNKTLAAAKTEGKVVLYTTAGADIRTAFTNSLKEKYGLEMEFVTGKGVEMITKILSERRAGLYTGDAYMAGSTSTMSMLVPEGVMDVMGPEFIVPEVGDATKWYGNKLPYIDKEGRLLGFRGSIFWPFTINTTLVKPGELASYNDLLKPAFKGKIAMADPTIEGASNSFVALVSEYLMGPDYIKALIRQEPFMSRDERLLTEWVARGKYSVLIGTKPDPIAEFLRAGAPLLPVIPKEGSMIEPGAGTISVMTKRPHPNATRVFINWLLSKEGQTLYAEGAGIESAREDVSKAHLGAGLVREPGKKYIFGDDEFRKIADKVVQQSKEDFKPLLK